MWNQLLRFDHMAVLDLLNMFNDSDLDYGAIRYGSTIKDQ